ncbi:MAG: hypothetical protein IT200_15465 [Thermoleophilia bacterium]|nr:hypothetical protein [Thermoleophilia bacterium]
MTGAVAVAHRPRAARRGRRAVLRRRVAPAAGLAFLLAGGALCVRVTAATLLGGGEGPEWLFTGAACVLAGVALVLLAFPEFVPSAQEGTEGSRPAPPRG